MSISERIYDEDEAKAENPNRAKMHKGPFELLEAYKGLKSLLERVHSEYYGHKPTPVFRDGVIVRQGDGYNFAVEYIDPEPLPMPDPSTLGPWGAAWLAAGEENSWIRCANDPPFDIRQFRRCGTARQLASWIAVGNWCLGSAFYWKDQCWINQVNGGSEYLGIKQDVVFESISAEAIAGDCDVEIHADSFSRWPYPLLPADNDLVQYFVKIDEATVEECRKLEYD